jgi:hypothetical protein
MTGLHYKPTAAELVAAVAEFLETEVRDGTGPEGGAAALRFHARVAANVLRTVERELLDDTSDEPLQALRTLGFTDEAELAAAIRAGRCGDEVLPALHALVRHRLRVAHPGYEQE